MLKEEADMSLLSIVLGQGLPAALLETILMRAYREIVLF
jgi:hypothetical protein